MLRFHLVSLFPEFFRSPLETALLGRAREAGIVDFSFHDPRSFSTSRHHHVDDRPYGGGPGMVMQGEPVAAALRSIEKPGRMILLAPSGRPLNDALARELAREEDLTLICGRYEGLDARLLDIFPLHSPFIDHVEVVSQGRVRRSRLYYLRALKGKAARIKPRGRF